MTKRKVDSTRPEPVPVNVVCSLCGEPWSFHAEVAGEVSTLECIRLLKAKAQRPTFVPQPYPVYPRPWYAQPYWVTWTSAQGSLRTASSGNFCQSQSNTTTRTPVVASASAA